MSDSASELPPRAAQANSRRKQQVNRLGKTVVEQMKLVSDEQA